MRDRQRQWLARVPYDAQLSADEPASNYPANQEFKGVGREPGIRVAVGQVAVVAADIAERRRLHDEQGEFGGDRATIGGPAPVGAEPLQKLRQLPQFPQLFQLFQFAQFPQLFQLPKLPH